MYYNLHILSCDWWKNVSIWTYHPLFTDYNSLWRIVVQIMSTIVISDFFRAMHPRWKSNTKIYIYFLRRKYERKFMFVDKIKIIKRELLLPPHYNFHCHFWKSVKRKEKMSNFRSSLGCGITQKWENIYNSNKKEQWKFLVIFLKGALKVQSVTLLPKF